MMPETNPEFRYRPLWLIMGYALVVLIIYLSLTGSPPEVDFGLDFQDKLFHVLAYFAMMGWFSQIYHVQTQRVIIAIVFVLMGVLLEYVQSFNPARYYETDDMIANMLGVAIAVLLAKTTMFRFILVRLESFIK